MSVYMLHICVYMLYIIYVILIYSIVFYVEPYIYTYLILN